MSALDLGALLADPQAGGVAHVAGPADGEWARADIAAADEELPLGVGHLAILAVSLPPEPWRIDALLRRVRERGFTGLAAPGARDLDDGSRRLAGRLGLAVLDAPRPFELAEASWRIAEARDALAHDLVRRLATAFRYPASDLRDLLAHLASSAGCGIALLDADGVLDQAGGDLGPASAAIDTAHDTDIRAVDGMSIASVRVDSPSRPGLRLVFFARGVTQAQRMALAVAAQVAMPAVAARILIDEVDEVSDASASSELLRDFLTGDDGERADVARRMADRGWRTTGFHLGFRVIGRSRLEPRDLLRLVSGELGAVRAETHATTTARGVTGWVRFAERPAPAELDQHVRALRALHRAVRGSANVATGVGTLQEGPAGLAATLRDAVDAARIASDRGSSEWFVRVDAFGLEQLLLARTESDTFVPAAEALLDPLRRDGMHLVETLGAYLDAESGIAATAAALEIHRNTVAQRVRRIEELLGADLRDPQTRLALHLACRAVLR